MGNFGSPTAAPPAPGVIDKATFVEGLHEFGDVKGAMNRVKAQDHPEYGLETVVFRGTFKPESSDNAFSKALGNFEQTGVPGNELGLIQKTLREQFAIVFMMKSRDVTNNPEDPRKMITQLRVLHKTPLQ